MKIYSQIKGQAEPEPPAEPIRHSQFSFHNSAAQSINPPRSQISDVSSRSQKSKFSFRLQPQLYFQQNNPQKEMLYQQPPHIRLASSSSSQSLKELSQQLKATISRKKIFDESKRVTILNEGGLVAEKVESKLPHGNQQPPEEPKKVEAESKPLVSILKKSIESEQPIAINNNSSFQPNRDRSKRHIQRVQFVHEDTDKYLTQPILQDLSHSLPPPSLLPKKQDAGVDNNSKMYSVLNYKIEDNERRLTELSRKLDKKIEQDNKRNDHFMRLLTSNSQMVHQKKLQREKEERQLSRLAAQKSSQKQRINLEIQQSKRLQQLILENRHLCAKVLQQASSNRPTSPSPEVAHIQQRIKELQSMRQNIHQNRTLNQSQSLHLNDSIIPPHRLNTTIQQSLHPYQGRGHMQVRDSTLSIKQPVQAQPMHQTFQMIPERGPSGHQGQGGRVVLVSKIY